MRAPSQATLQPPEVVTPSSLLLSAMDVDDGTTTPAPINTGSAQYSINSNKPAEDWAMIEEGCMALGTLVTCVVLYYVARHCSPTLMRHVYSPRTEDGRQMPPPIGLFAALRDDIAAVSAGEVGLEMAMTMRYIRHNLRLVGYAIFFSLVLLPVYGCDPHSHQTVAGGEVKWWSVLQMLTIAHVPEDNARLIIPGLCSLLFSLCYVYEQTHEWRSYVALKHRWLEADHLERFVVVLHAESEADIAVDEMRAELQRVVGEGEVLALVPIEQLRAGESGAGWVESATYKVLDEVGKGAATAAKMTRLEALRKPLLRPEAGGLVSEIGAEAAQTGRNVWEAVLSGLRLVLWGEEEPRVTRLVALFRSRRAAALAVGMSRWPGELLDHPGFVRAELAPAADDVYWPNLLRPKWRLRANKAAAYALTVVLFAFWTVPVGAVQALSSASALAQIPALSWLADLLIKAGPEASARIEGFLSALILQAFLYLTLSSGLFQRLARFEGAVSESQVSLWAVERIFLFQLLLVLLVSNITSSLFDSMRQLLEKPTQLPTLLAQNLPGQATFFLHYILNAVLVTAVLEVLQLFSLCRLLWRAIRRCCCARQGEPPLREAPPPPPYSESARRQRHNYVYSKLVLMSGVWLTFFLVAPLAPLYGLVYFLPSYAIYAAVARHVDGPPQVDTAGGCWEAAIRYQNWTLLLALLMFFGILLLKDSIAGAVLALISLGYVMVRTHRLRIKFSGQASALSLQKEVDLGEVKAAAAATATGTGAAAAAAAASLQPYTVERASW